MIVYLDASVLVALFTDDASSTRADDFVKNSALVFHLSDFGAAELASAIARKVRTGDIAPESARSALANFDIWRDRTPVVHATQGDDILRAETFIRRLDLNLRAPDAIHIAIALRLGLTLATFDERMAACARGLGLVVADA